MRERPRGCHEPYNIRWHIVGLHDVLRILARGLTPTADFDIHLAGRTCIVPSKYAENSGWLKPGGVAHNKAIRSISQAAREHNLGTRPLVLPLRDPQMQKSAIIRPRVRGIVDVQRSATAARAIPNAATPGN